MNEMEPWLQMNDTNIKKLISNKKCVEGEEPYVFWGHYVKGQGHRYRKYNF
jgi:hypothetical protein